MSNLLDPAELPLRLARELRGWQTAAAVAADGSDRRFYRLSRAGSTCILLYHPRPPGDPVTENDSYHFIGRHLHAAGVPVPEILAYCREEGWFLLEDLGDTSLHEHYLRHETEPDRLAVYLQALDVLVGLQIAGSQGFSPSWCFDTPAYDAALVKERECLYFLQAFVQDYLGLEISWEDLADDFHLLLDRALLPASQLLLHRDFQSRNLMVCGRGLGLIDFQGARLGPPQYDLAALLLDPYVCLPTRLQERLVDEYLAKLRQHLDFDPAVWRQRYEYVALCRNLQILGAYGFLTRQKGKTFFRQFIPAACWSLQNRLRFLPAPEFPALRRLADRIRNLVG